MGLVIGVQSLAGSQLKSSKPEPHECLPCQTQLIAYPDVGSGLRFGAAGLGGARLGKANPLPFGAIQREEVWLGLAGLGVARLGGARLGAAWQGKANPLPFGAIQRAEVWLGWAGQGMARQGWARQGAARQTHCPLEQFRGQKFGLAGHGGAWRGEAWLGAAGQTSPGEQSPGSF